MDQIGYRQLFTRPRALCVFCAQAVLLTNLPKNMNTNKAANDASLAVEQEKLFAAENFAELFEEYEKDSQRLVEGTVVKGVIVGISDKGVAIDIGAKSVGFIDIAEFKRDGEINEGDVVDVFLERLENKKGELVISRDNARRYINWHYLKNCLEDKTVIEGFILGKVKGGYAVDINGITCFLPRSQVDTIDSMKTRSTVWRMSRNQ